MNILLIEPNKLLATTFQAALEQAGCMVLHAKTAQQAVHVLDHAEQTPDAIVLEFQLNSHSGVEFLYELRSYAEWQDIPVLLHSFVPPKDLEDMRWQLDRLGVVDHLYKPTTSLKHLVQAVKSHAALA